MPLGYGERRTKQLPKAHITSMDGITGKAIRTHVDVALKQKIFIQLEIIGFDI